MNRNRLLQMLTILAIGATLVVNVLANTLPIGGRTTAEVSDSFDVLFVPAGYVFSIWGLIYLGLIAFALVQARSGLRDDSRLVGIRSLVILSCVANSTWIWLWHHLQFEWTLVAMAVLLFSLIAIYRRLGIGRQAAPSGIERWAVDAVFSLYLGWITVATIANVTVVLAHRQWSGLGMSDEAWTIALLAVGNLLAALMAVRHRDWIYPLVLAWAFAGIGVAQAESTVAVWAYVAAAVAVMSAVAALLPHAQPPRPAGV